MCMNKLYEVLGVYKYKEFNTTTDFFKKKKINSTKKLIK